MNVFLQYHFDFFFGFILALLSVFISLLFCLIEKRKMKENHYGTRQPLQTNMLEATMQAFIEEVLCQINTATDKNSKFLNMICIH